MATATAKRRTTNAPEKLRAASLSNVGQWHMDANLANRLFGPSKFSEVEQADNPNAQMTRVIKDVVRVGKWKRGTDRTGRPVLLDITPEMLSAAATNFKLAKSRGVNFNLGKNHPNPATDLIHPDDLIAEIEDVVIVGDTLWASAYVTPADKVYLSNRARKVSAGLRWDWSDGLGNVYEIQMPHIAVTDNPIVSGQGPFVFLSNSPQPTESEGNTQGATPVDEQLVEILNRFLALTNLGQLPEGITEQNLYVVLNALLGTIESDDEESDDADPSRSGQTLPPLNPSAGANMPAELANTNPAAPGTPAANGGTPAPAAVAPAPQVVNLSNVVMTQSDGSTKSLAEILGAILTAQTKQTADIANLSNSIQAIQGEKVTNAKAAYSAEIERLKTVGDITVAVGDAQMQVGELVGWNLSNLACFKGAKMVDLANRAKAGASAGAPAVDGVTQPLSEADVEQGVNLLLGKKVAAKPAAAA